MWSARETLVEDLGVLYGSIQAMRELRSYGVAETARATQMWGAVRTLLVHADLTDAQVDTLRWWLLRARSVMVRMHQRYIRTRYLDG